MLRFVMTLVWLGTPGLAESGRLLIHFLQLPVGEERYELSTGGTLQSHFEYTERGSKVELNAVLEMKPDLTPVRFEAHGRSYRPFSVDVSVTPDVTERGPFFTISGYSPLAVQMMMLRYWLGHGRPRTMKQLPEGSSLTIEMVGSDLVNGERLRRYSIGGVVWGRESVWLNGRDEIAGAVTYAGNLPLEAVREEYQTALPQLIASATHDRMKEMAAIRIRPLAEGSFAVVNATLIDGNGGAPIEKTRVVVRDGRIVAVGPAAAIPNGAKIVDARGKTLLPGLWEMHAHYAQVEYGPAYLAAGVTTARDLGGEFEFLRTLKGQGDRFFGPRLILAGLADGSGEGTFGVNWADTPAEGRAMVAKYKAAGFAQMKVYNRIRPEVLRAIAEEAHREGMSVAGHVPNGMTLFEGVEAGMDQICHMGPVIQAVRAVGLAKTVRFLKDHGTVIDPTLAWGELLSHPKEVDIASFEPGFSKAPGTLRAMIGSASGQGARLTESFEILRGLFEAGVPIVAGTDKAVPAHSLHRELELYVEAGIPPMDVIRLATIGSARVMGLEKDAGSVEVGKRADMILVDGNPIADFGALRRVVWVVANGRMMDPGPLWEAAGFRP